MSVKLIADSGATKCEWCLLINDNRKKIITQGISPYFLTADQIIELLQKELLPELDGIHVDAIYYYGTGLGNKAHILTLKKALHSLFPGSAIEAQSDLLAAARAVCGKEKGIACILGTGSNSCYYNGHKIVKNSPGLGYILGDEGSGAYLGKKLLQYYLYNTLDEDLRSRFDARFMVTNNEILENVYMKPLANRYLASFAIFLAENRGHYMIENIIEDGLHDFFFIHLYKYRETWKMPINFVGSIAFGFRDVLADLCKTFELQLGKILQHPMDGLIEYHIENLYHETTR